MKGMCFIIAPGYNDGLESLTLLQEGIIIKFIYTERGGIRYGLESISDQINYTFPFAKLILYDNYLIIRYPFKKEVSFIKNNVVSFEAYKKSISSGIKINHNISDLDPLWVFWSRNPQKLLNILRDKGWSVK